MTCPPCSTHSAPPNRRSITCGLRLTDEIERYPVGDRYSDTRVRSVFPWRFDSGVVAVAHAGIPRAKTVAERLDLPLAYVRAEAREPDGPLVECEPGAGDQAVIVEDVVASGGSAARAIQALLARTTLS